MDRKTYLNRLSRELSRWVSGRERQNILRYYEEYFDEAGPEGEQAVIAELGDPETLARQLAENGGTSVHEYRGPQLWQIVIGAVVVVALSIPIMLISQLIVGRGIFNLVTRDEIVFTTDTEPWPGSWEEPLVTIPAEGSDDWIDVDINVTTGDVAFRAGDVAGPSVEFGGAVANSDVNWDFDGSCLWVRSFGNPGFDGITGIDVTVVVPASWELGDVNIFLNAGDVDLGEFECHDLYVNTEMGDIQVEGATAASYVFLYTNMGDIAYTAPLGADADLLTDLGDITVVALDGASGSYSYSLNTSLGQVKVDGRNCGSQAHLTISEYSDDYRGHLSATTSLGDIDLTFAAEAVTARDDIVTVLPGGDSTIYGSIVITEPSTAES